MTYDMNDIEPQRASELIADGSFARVTMSLRPGGVDGESAVDRGLLKRSGTPGSDVLMLDAEFTVTEGPYARRKFWQTFTVAGGKLDEAGVSIGAKITKGALRAMIDSALGLDPADMSEAAKAKRILRGFSDLNGIGFVAKIGVEASRSPGYSDRNRLDHAVLPTEAEWQKVMAGESVPARPSSRARGQTPASATTPAWNSPQQSPAQPARSAAAPAWAPGNANRPAEPKPAAAASSGPAWLNG